jgi:caffeoyl-CoA O-methyltransferase
MADDDSRQGVRYADAAIVAWVDGLHARLDPALKLAFEAPTSLGLPAIQVGPSEGRLLGLFCQLAGVKKAVEVGTLAGFSALHIARALPADGHLWTIEIEPAHAAAAEVNLAAAGLSGRATVVLGSGQEALPGLEAHGPFDLVFIDADKEGYDFYGRWAARNLRPGGLLIADNAYLFGHLLDDSPVAAAVRRLHEEAALAFDTVCIPTPDGLLLGIKK